MDFYSINRGSTPLEGTNLKYPLTTPLNVCYTSYINYLTEKFIYSVAIFANFQINKTYMNINVNAKVNTDIFIIDDEPMNTTLISAMVKSFGFSSHQYNDAKHFFRDNKFNDDSVIILDLSVLFIILGARHQVSLV